MDFCTRPRWEPLKDHLGAVTGYRLQISVRPHLSINPPRPTSPDASRSPRPARPSRVASGRDPVTSGGCLARGS
jgi:hypothetical protein